MPNPVKITEDSNMVFSKTMQIYGKDFRNPNIEAKKIEAILTDRFNSTKFFKKNPNRNKKIKNRTKLIFSQKMA